MDMIPIILNENFERAAEIDDFISFIWTTRYYSSGDFELCADISRSDVLVIGNYVTRRNDDAHVGIIETIEFQYTEEHEEMIIVSGRFLPALLSRRIISSQTQLSGVISECIKNLISENAINPAISDRTIPGFTFSSSISSNDEMDAQYTGENLLDTIASICETYSIGFDCTLGDNTTFNFSLYEGVDRSYAQTANPYVVFSDLYDNLLSSQFDEDRKTYVTDVLVGGEGEGINQTIVWAAKDSQSGLNRYESYLDASSAVTNDNIITQETYESQLLGLGLEQITSYTTAFSGEVDFTNVRLGVDVNVGDVCVIENTRWGIYINSRLVEVIESVGEDGAYTAVPTFGT